ENFAETLLPQAAARATTAFFQSVNKIRARGLHRRINTHQQSGQNRQSNRKDENRERKTGGGVPFNWKKIRRHFWHNRNNPPRYERADSAGDDAHKQALKDKKADDAGTRSTDRHSQRDFAAAPAETNQQQVGDVAACDEQNKTNRGEQRDETRAEILRHVFGQRTECRGQPAVNLVRVLWSVALVERRQRRFHLLELDVRLESTDHAQKARATHHSFIGEPGKLEWFRGPDLRDWIRSKPGRRHVWQHAYNRM